MSPENKQRIVGVVVLMAFIALLIPFLFTNGIKKNHKSAAVETQIPIQSNSGTTEAVLLPPESEAAEPDVDVVKTPVARPTNTANIPVPNSVNKPTSVIVPTVQQATSDQISDHFEQPDLVGGSLQNQAVKAASTATSAARLPQPPVVPITQKQVNVVEKKVAQLPKAPVSPPAVVSNKTDVTSVNKTLTKSSDLTAAVLAEKKEMQKNGAIGVEKDDNFAGNGDVVSSETTTKTVKTVKVGTKKLIKMPVASKTVPQHVVTAKHAVLKKEPVVVVHKIKKIVVPNEKVGELKEFWSVQVGSFSEQSRIQNFVTVLRNKGFHVYVQKIVTSSGELVRVLVGYEPTRERAAVIAKQLEKKAKIKGHLVRNIK